jgi:glycosyltransferase involved in cell wall biosynthesis
MARPPKTLSILHVVDSLEFGGLERVVSDLAQAQLAHGHTVTVFSINRTEGLLPELTRAGVSVLIGDKSRGWDLEVLKKLRHAAAQVDVVHAHNFVPNYYSAAALLAARRRPAQVCTCHDMGLRLKQRRLRWMFRLSLARTSRVAMVGRQVHDRFVSTGLVPEARANTVMNGVPVQRFAPSPPRRAAAREALGLSPSALVIGCVGRLVPLKNHRIIIGVMPALVAKHPELRLVIIGAGELAAELKAQVQAVGMGEHVVLAGQRSDVGDLLPAFDVFALPSLTEGLSISLLEAGATGLALVATAVGGNPEVVSDGQTGLLVSVDDGPALAAALARLIDNPEERSRLGKAAFEWVRANGSIEALCEAYDALYRQAIGSAM